MNNPSVTTPANQHLRHATSNGTSGLQNVKTSDPSGEESDLHRIKTTASTIKNERGW